MEDIQDNVLYEPLDTLLWKFETAANNLSTNKCSEIFIQFSFLEIGIAFDHLNEVVLRMEKQKIINENSINLFLDTHEKNILPDLAQRLIGGQTYLNSIRS